MADLETRVQRLEDALRALAKRTSEISVYISTGNAGGHGGGSWQWVQDIRATAKLLDDPEPPTLDLASVEVRSLQEHTP
jgi:hypothetical protein